MSHGMRRALVRAATLIGMIAAPGPARGGRHRATRGSSTSRPSAAGGSSFVYADDLWTARPDGSDVRRLTVAPRRRVAPRTSRPTARPSPSRRATTATPTSTSSRSTGGEPTRLTWHPGADAVRGFTPDGAGPVLVAAVGLHQPVQPVLHRRRPRAASRRSCRSPAAFRAAYSPDGKYLAYTPLAEPFRQWKNYRGGTASRIWVVKLDDLAVEPIPQPEGRCNDTYPMWVGDTVYFLSDRDGEFNLFSYDREVEEGRAAHPARRLPDRGRLGAAAARSSTSRPGSSAPSTPSASEPKRLKVGVAADLVETRPRFAKGAEVRPRAPTSRRPASGPCSSSAARSSPSPPRRATSAT